MHFINLRFGYFLVCSLLSFVPGRVGQIFETKKLFIIKDLRNKKTKEEFDRAVKSLGDGSVAIDLGANVGFVTEQLAMSAGHVYAFEPDPWAFEQLKARVQRFENVTLFQAAATDFSGTANLKRLVGFEDNPEGRSQGSTLQESDEMFYELQSGEISVQTINFIEFLENLETEVDLIKVDIEGSEIGLLNSMLDSKARGKVKQVFCETHEAQMPHLRVPTRVLRKRVATINKPKIFLDWA